MSTKKTKKAKVKPRTLFRIYKVFGRHYKPYWRTILLSLTCLMITIGVVTLVPWPLKIIIDYIVLKEPLPDSLAFMSPLLQSDPTLLLIIMASLIVMLALLEAVFSYMNKFWISSTGDRMNADIRERVFEHLQRLSLSFHESSKSGDIIYMLTSDVPKLKDVLISFPQDLISRTGTFLSAVIIMLMLDWRLGVMAVSTIPVLYFCTWYFGAKMNKAMKVARKKEGQVASIINENISSIALIQAYGREESERERFDRQNQASLRHKLKTLLYSKTYGRVSDFVIILTTAAIIYFGGRYALNGAILPGTLVVFVAYLREIYGVVNSFSKMFLKLATSQVSCEHLVELVETDMVVEDSSGAKAAESLNGDIEFRDVSFAYKDGQNVLENVDFKINAGETVALVGHSGAGKSTLISMLLRFYDPQQGGILIDGKDIREYTLKSLRDQITILLQDAQLFQISVRKNIAFGKKNAEEGEIVQAAKLAEAHDFIEDMPKGYDTKMLESGRNLSGGQRQRINIARAIIRNKPIVILDEPNTGLDARSEARVNEAIKHLTAGKTAFIIAHKYASIAGADKILLLDEGRVAHLGTHQELMEESEKYREYYELQFGKQKILESAGRLDAPVSR